MYRLLLIDTRTTVIPVAIVPVGSVPNAVFVFLIATITVPISAVIIPIAAMIIPVGAVYVVTVSLAAVAVLAPQPVAAPPSPDKPPVGPTSLSKTNVRHPGDCPAVVVGDGCTRSLLLMLPPCSNGVPLTFPINFHYISLFLSHMHSHADSRLRTKTHAQRNSRTT